MEDVQAALAFSNETGVRLSVKNKGHDYKGRSSGRNTLALWVSTGLRNRVFAWESRDMESRPQDYEMYVSPRITSTPSSGG